MVDDGQGISPLDLESVGLCGCTRHSQLCYSIFNFAHQFCSKFEISLLPGHTYGRLGRSLACIAATSHITIISAVSNSPTFSKTLNSNTGEKSNVEFCKGFHFVAPGTRVICSKIFERRQALRLKQQSEFRAAYSKFVRFLGMLILMHLSCPQVHAPSVQV